MPRKNILIALIFLVVCGLGVFAFSTQAQAATYYVSNGGLDSNDGLDPLRSWKTISKINSQTFNPGDYILFKKGDVWREHLVISSSGAPNSPITFGSYGSGNKPLLLGSVNKNNSSDWTNIGSNKWATADNSFPYDTGFMILGADATSNVGVKFWTLQELDAEKEFWYDGSKKRVVVYSDQNPAIKYLNIEIALPRFRYDYLIKVGSKKYINIEDLALKYSDTIAISINNGAQNIQIKNCDIGFIGGGWHGVYDGVNNRYGNAIEIWNNVHDITVDGCKIWQVFDAAVTFQAVEPNISQYNISFTNNIIWYSEYSFELFNYGSGSRWWNNHFENNVNIGAGWGWGHDRRSDASDPPSGYHIRAVDSVSSADGIFITGNVFYEAKKHLVLQGISGMANFVMDNNYYYQENGDMINYLYHKYPMSQFASYQSYSKQDQHSVSGNKKATKDKARAIVSAEDVSLLNKLFLEIDANCEGIDCPMCMTPSITPSGGSLTQPVNVSFNTVTPGAIMRYTMDGTEPDNNSRQYGGPFTLEYGAVVKVKAFKDGLAESAVATEKFSITNARYNRAVMAQGDGARLERVFEKGRNGENIIVGVIGGSITQGIAASAETKRYANIIANWWKNIFPKASVTLVNAGWSATNSLFGAHRMEGDLLSVQPDFVILEYAVNDANTIQSGETLEGMVRQALKKTNLPTVMLLFMTYDTGQSAQLAHSPVGNHYGLPMISYHDALWPEIQAGTLPWSSISSDTVHPNDTGHHIAAELVNTFLSEKLISYTGTPNPLAIIPVSLYSDIFEFTQRYNAINLQPISNFGWQIVGDKWVTQSLGSEMNFSVSGEVISLRFNKERNVGIIRVSIDGGDPIIVNGWGNHDSRVQSTIVAKNLGSGEHNVNIKLTGKDIQSSGSNFELQEVLIAGVYNPTDVNGDGQVNIKDIQICIKVITNSQTDQNIIDKCRVLADPPGTTNIKDIQIIIRKIINS